MNTDAMRESDVKTVPPGFADANAARMSEARVNNLERLSVA
jgi:hypothetical protein